MQLKLDENIPERVSAELAAIGHEAHTCLQEGIAGAGDSAVAACAKSEGRLLITCDLDFSDIRRFPPGTHPGIAILRLRRPDIHSIQAALARLFATVLESEVPGNLIIVEDNNIRIRKPAITP